MYQNAWGLLPDQPYESQPRGAGLRQHVGDGLVQRGRGGCGDGDVAGEPYVVVPVEQLLLAAGGRVGFATALAGGAYAEPSASSSSDSSAVAVASACRSAVPGSTGAMVTEMVRVTEPQRSSSGARKSMAAPTGAATP